MVILDGEIKVTEQAEIFDVKENLHFYFDHSSFKIPDNIQNLINQNWKNNITCNPHLFNGDVICLKEITKNNGKIDFIFNRTDYAHFLASYQNTIPPEFQCRNLHTSALIETADNFIAFAKMGNNSFDSGRYQFIGGGLDLRFIENTKINFAQCIKTELLEEINLDIDHKGIVASCDNLYFGITKNRGGLSMIYRVKLKINSFRFEEKMQAYNKTIAKTCKAVEVAGLVFVNKDNYKEKIAQIENTKTHIDSNLFSTLAAYFDKNVSNIENIIDI